MAKGGDTGITNAYTDDMLSRERTMDCIMHCSLGDNTIYSELSMIWRRDKSSPSGRIRSTEGRGSSDSKATADSHRAAQGSLNEMEMSRQRSCRDVLLIWLVKLQERVKRVDTFVRDNCKRKKLFLTILTPQNWEINLHSLFWSAIAIDRAWSN